MWISSAPPKPILYFIFSFIRSLPLFIKACNCYDLCQAVSSLTLSDPSHSTWSRQVLHCASGLRRSSLSGQCSRFLFLSAGIICIISSLIHFCYPQLFPFSTHPHVLSYRRRPSGRLRCSCDLQRSSLSTIWSELTIPNPFLLLLFVCFCKIESEWLFDWLNNRE